MSNKFPKFRITIVGDTAQELFDNIRGYLSWSAMSDVQGAGVGRDNPAQPEEEEQEDFLTQAATNPFAPSAVLRSPLAPAPEWIQKVSGTETVAGHVDSKGMPWDARIHSASREIKKDGSWRYRRGAEDNQIQAVEQELIGKVKHQQAAEMTPSVPVWLPPPVALVPVQSGPSPASPPVHAPGPVPLAPPPMPSPVALPNAHTVETFQKLLVPTLAKLIKDGKLTQDYINALKAHFGVDEIHKVSPQQAEEMFHNFVQYGMIAKAE